MVRKKKNTATLLAGNKTHRLFLLCSLLISFLSNGQPAFLDSLQTGLTRYKNEVVQEKVFVHTDKSFYLTGETLWFKAYVVDAKTHREMDLSKVVYVELLTDKGRPALQATIDNRQSTGDGSFLLPSSLNTGMYTLRAYTAWMKNFDEAFYFQTPIEIVNTTKRPDWLSLETKESYAVQFFPEGGNLVEGIQSRIGFQLVNQYGQGADGEGVVVKNGSDTVAHFRPLKFGIGSFEFAPQKDAVYKAFIRLRNGEKLSANLPQVYKEGYVLGVTEGGNEQVRLSVFASNGTDNLTVYLLAHNRGDVKLASTKRIATGKAEWVVDKKDLGDGINVFTLFDANKKPVCERLYFKKPTNKLSIDVTSDAKEYATRSNVSLDITAKDNEGVPVKTNLSLSVFLLDSLQGMSQPSIEEYLWLVSELKGNVESPAYYFENDNGESTTALDNLLLTQGWRRFTWEDIENKQSPQFSFLPEYEGSVIKGKVMNKRTGEPVPNVLCYLSAPGEKFYVANAVSNSEGNLAFVAQDLYGPVELAAQASSADSNLRVDLQSPYSEKYAVRNPVRFVLPERRKEDLMKRHLNAQVLTSFATPASQRFNLPTIDSLPFYGKPDARYALDEYTRFPSMEEVMREITPEVYVYKENNKFRYTVLNLPYRAHFDSPPLVLLDGVPVFNVSKIISFDPLKVKWIDIVARKYFWGNTVNSGIVSYTTYDGNLGGFELDPGVVLLEYNGLQVKREFYSPSYNTAEQLRSRDPDKRNVLLWSPAIRTDAQGKKEISFYTSDVPGRYAVRVQGIGGNGLAGSSVITFAVK